MSISITRYRSAAAIGIAAVSSLTSITSAQATVRIGSALLVEQNVVGSISGQVQKVLKGDDVFENEYIRTEIASHARLLFVDKSQLVLGPTASAKLDRLVFNPDRSVNTLAVNTRAGASRWISGDSVSSAYLIETPVVTIRPHGTTFDLLVEPQRTTVVLQEGIIEVCLIDAPQRCRVLSRRGEFVRATRADLEATQQGGPGLWEFEDRCLSASSRECVIGRSANQQPEPPQNSGGNKKRAEPSKPNRPKEANIEPRTPKKKYEEPQEPQRTAKKKYEEPQEPQRTSKKKHEEPQEPQRTAKKSYDPPPQRARVTESPTYVSNGPSPNVLGNLLGAIVTFKALGAYNHGGSKMGPYGSGKGPGSGTGQGYSPLSKGPISSPAPKSLMGSYGPKPMMGSSSAPKAPMMMGSSSGPKVPYKPALH
jgi:hypothetical protein